VSAASPGEGPFSGVSPELIESARGGSPEALGALLELCRPYLLDVANKELPEDLKAKAGGSDLVQQTFLEASQGFGEFHGSTEAELLAWLRRILLHNVANFTRRFHTEKREVGREENLDAGHGQKLAAPGPSPSSAAAGQDEDQRMLAALARLPDDQRTAVRLRQQDRLTFSQIGKRLGCSAEAARKTWARGIERLREELRRSDERPDQP
jgi:RNA polymerase sigma-70 factor (ECF subfamily)